MSEAELKSASKGVLYVVATPIGNMQDMTARAIEVLGQVDLIACEDTRRAGLLTGHFAIKTTLLALHDHNEEQAAGGLIKKLRNGQNIALISDAGTPLISDPGYKLLQRVITAGISVVPIPGACALIAALSGAGLPTDRFSFEGFMPHKASGRVRALELLSDQTATLIFYESKHRIMETLDLMLQVLGDRRCAIARELTKTFEQFYRGRLSQVIEQLKADEKNQLGEFVVMLEGNQNPVNPAQKIEQVLFDRLLQELPPKKAAHITAEITGADKKALYQQVIDRSRS